MTNIWDAAFLKQRERDAREDALAAQTDDDWESAVMQFERAMSDGCGGFRDCPLPGCRRALRCVGNKPICMPRCKVEFEPGVEQQLVENFYAEIQEERRNAAADGRAPYVEHVMTHRGHQEEAADEVEEQEENEAADEPASTPACDERESNSRAVPEAPRSEVAPSKPPPQLRKPEPAAAPPVPPTVAVASPEPEPPPEPEPQLSEVEQRVNRIWADYVEARRRGDPPPRPGPRIRLL
jgi:hypothetical protein